MKTTNTDTETRVRDAGDVLCDALTVPYNPNPQHWTFRHTMAIGSSPAVALALLRTIAQAIDQGMVRYHTDDDPDSTDSERKGTVECYFGAQNFSDLVDACSWAMNYELHGLDGGTLSKALYALCEFVGYDVDNGEFTN